MSRVSGVTGPGPLQSARTQATKGGAEFSVTGGPEAAEGALPSLPTQPVGLAAMLVLQQAEAADPRKKGRQLGFALLDALQALQHDLLHGTETASLSALAGLAQEVPPGADPQLAGLLAEIRLRARIELLRRGVETG
jgi:hypothetical protein